jgi:uncharacterized membrane protein
MWVEKMTLWISETWPYCMLIPVAFAVICIVAMWLHDRAALRQKGE